MTKKSKPKAKTPKKKSATRVKSDDDSDMEPEEVEGTKKRKAGGGFQKPFNLSYPLQEVCGEAQVGGHCPIGREQKTNPITALTPTGSQETLGAYQSE